MPRKSVSFLVAAAALLAACGGRTTFVSIRHPLQVGAVDANQVPFDNSREESRRQLPAGALLDQAELLSLTPDQICARVTLWADQLHPERANFGGYRIALLNDQEGVENSNAQIAMEQPRVAAYNGIRREARYTGGYVPVRAVATPFVWQITSQPATLCFPNGGFVTPSTTRLMLELQDAGANNRINFEWEFSSSVAQ